MKTRAGLICLYKGVPDFGFSPEVGLSSPVVIKDPSERPLEKFPKQVRKLVSCMWGFFF